MSKIAQFHTHCAALRDAAEWLKTSFQARVTRLPHITPSVNGTPAPPAFVTAFNNVVADHYNALAAKAIRAMEGEAITLSLAARAEAQEIINITTPKQ